MSRCVYCSPHSNTTNVKVKLNMAQMFGNNPNYQNTTNVKVKPPNPPMSILQAIKPEYNQC